MIRVICGQEVGLELQPSGKLHLPLAEQRAVSTGNVPEWIRPGTVKCQRRTRLVVNGAVHEGDLSAVEDVKAFRQHFEFYTFSQAEPT